MTIDDMFFWSKKKIYKKVRKKVLFVKKIISIKRHLKCYIEFYSFEGLNTDAKKIKFFIKQKNYFIKKCVILMNKND